eukprot:COSAG02_NODE_841_length_16613_cov_61.635703_11_plen_86_part_00
MLCCGLSTLYARIALLLFVLPPSQTRTRRGLTNPTTEAYGASRGDNRQYGGCCPLRSTQSVKGSMVIENYCTSDRSNTDLTQKYF